MNFAGATTNREVIHRRTPEKMREAVESATLEWVAGFNPCRLLAPLGYPPG